MALSFTICWLPVKRSSRGVDRLIPLRNHAAVVAYNVKLSEMANLFSIACKQICELQGPSPIPDYSRGLVKSLHVQGQKLPSFPVDSKDPAFRRFLICRLRPLQTFSAQFPETWPWVGTNVLRKLIRHSDEFAIGREVGVRDDCSFSPFCFGSLTFTWPKASGSLS